MDGNRVRWGIISTAKIGREKVIPGIKASQTGVAAAIASRDLDRAKQVASDLGIEKAYGSYEELFADPDIDAIYNPLPTTCMFPVTAQAVEAGKHVLCEKPMALSADEAATLLDLPKDRLVAEGFMVGRIRNGSGRATSSAPANWASFTPSRGSSVSSMPTPATSATGRIWAAGHSWISAATPMLAGRYFFEAEPERVVSLIDRDPDFGTDRITSAMMDFGAGRQLTFTVSPS